MSELEPVNLAVHRCRFVDYAPSAITALAFSPLPLPSSEGKRTAVSQPKYFGALAVGHANGDIDLYDWSGHQNTVQSSQAWVPRKTLSGIYPSKVDSLAFAVRYPRLTKENDTLRLSGLRLFSSGGGNELLEWDLERGTVKQTIGSQGGSIWCIAVNPASTLVALGCEDGTVRLISLDSDTLTNSRKFDRVKGRILSVAWGPPRPSRSRENLQNDDTSDDDDDEWEDSWLVTGCSDSSLRKWDVATGRVVDRMGTEKVKGERTLVWTVGVLGNGTIISGDSLGIVKFWDARTCTQLQSFQSHGADVLCMTIGPDGKSVYTAGVDQKITQYILVKTQDTEKTQMSTRWVQAASRRMHSHDIRTMAIWPPYTAVPPNYQRLFSLEVAPVLASGGLDMTVVLTPAALPSSTIVKVQNPLATSTEATFEDSYHRKLAYTTRPSCTSPIQISKGAGLISCLRESGVTIWRIKRTAVLREKEVSHEATEERLDNWERLVEMGLNNETNLLASAISDDGRWFVVSDYFETKLFQLIPIEDGQLKVKRIRDFTSALQPYISSPISSTGGAAFRFTPDSHKLIMTTTTLSAILVIDLSVPEPRVLRKFDHHRFKDLHSQVRLVVGRNGDEHDHGDVEMGEDTQGGESEESDKAERNEHYDEGTIPVDVLRLAISPDGQWLATSDNLARMHVFNLDSVRHHSTLPSFPHPAQALAFDPSHPGLLMIAFPDNTLYFYDVESRQSPLWARNLCANLPKRLTHAHDPILGIAFDIALHQTPSVGDTYVLLWGSTWICKLPLSGRTNSNSEKKRRRDSGSDPLDLGSGDQLLGLRMVTHYRPILMIDYIGPKEIVVVERPLMDVLSTLPPAYFKQKYGVS